MPRFAANLGFLWPDLPLLQRIDAAAAAGFRAVEFHFPYDVAAAEVAAACHRQGLSVLGINTNPGDRTRGEFGMGAVPGREREFQAAIDQSIAYCIGSGARAIHCMAGMIRDAERPDASRVFRANLQQALDKIGALDIALLLEPLNARDHPGYYYSTLAEAAALIDSLANPQLKLQFDVYHVGISEGDVLTKLRAYLPMIGNVQIAAVPSRAEPDEGEIAYAAIFDALDAVGYAGWVGCEYRPRAGTDAGLAWLQKLGVRL